MTKTHQLLEEAWDAFNKAPVGEVPEEAFGNLYYAVSEICKRVDKIESMIGCAQALDAEVEAIAQALKDSERKGQ